MIKVTIRAGTGEPPNDVVFCPVLVCDSCGGLINVSSPANLIWYEPPDDPGYLAGEPQEVFAVHMGSCETAFRCQKGWPERGPNIRARELPRLLAINLGIRDAHYWPEAAASMQGMGLVEREGRAPLVGETRDKRASREVREGEA